MDTKEIAKVDESKVEKGIKEFQPNPAFVSAGSMLPKNYQDVMSLATIMAKSNIVPKEMIGRPEACAIAIMYGLELGLSPTQGIQNVMIVNGRPSLWGDAVKALVVGSGKCETFDEDAPHIALQQGFGRCRLVRRKEFGGGQLEIQFSIEDAKRAKLWTKQGPWQDYPGRMLMFRARGWACRDLFPDVMKGMQMREELEDYEIVHPAKSVEMPTRVKTPQNVQDATIVQSIKEGDIAPQIKSQEAESPSNDAQAPGDSPHDDPSSLKIDEERRKKLFTLRSKAKIDMATAKKWLTDHGHQDTSELTNAEADEFEAWIETQVKKS